MSLYRSTFTRPLVAAAMVVASALCAIAQQPPTPTRVRGIIEGVDGDVLMVKSRSGEDVKLHMTGDIKVAGIIRISLADIKLGSFIGTTTVPGADGRQNAVEVHVSRLRAKLGDAAIIRSLRGLGYRLEETRVA